MCGYDPARRPADRDGNACALVPNDRMQHTWPHVKRARVKERVPGVSADVQNHLGAARPTTLQEKTALHTRADHAALAGFSVSRQPAVEPILTPIR